LKKILFISLAVVLALSMALIGCTPEEGEGEGEGEVRTTGAYLDAVLITEEPNFAQAVARLQSDDLDVFAYGLADSDLFETVLGDPDLNYVSSLGSYNEFTFNPVGPVFNATGKLNPFAVQEFREAMNWLVDRDYIVDEIMGGLGVPRILPISTAGVDGTVRFPTEVAALEAEYAYDVTQAQTVINSVMTSLNATWESDMWKYDGEQVEIIGCIRTEDERQDMGDYFGDLLEDEGFLVTRIYGTSGVLSDYWRGDPNRGVFSYYTGGWVSTVIPLDEGDNFGAFYTNLWSAMGPLWQAYENDPTFYAAAEALWNYDYADMTERAGYFTTCLDKSMEESQRIWLCDRSSFSPMRNDVRLAHDAYGGIYGSWMWAQTAHFIDGAGDPILGGTMRIGTGGILTEPWNPVAGTNWVYDMFPIRATGDMGTQPDTQTGLRWDGRLEKADVVVQTGQPVEVENTDWCTLSFSPSIVVPLDAWADWDAETEEFLTVEDRFGSSETTAVRLTRAYFPEDIFEVPLHDGSTLSLGDFIMSAILNFDRAKPESDLYDEDYVAEFTAWMSVFKGVKFITDEPGYGLVVEFYSDLCQLNAELMCTYTSTFFPTYSQGPGMWHTIALGIKAEEDGDLAFGTGKATELVIEWTSFIAGPSIPILKDKLDEALAAAYPANIPYAPTLGDYVDAAEATERFTNLSDWYDAYNHFWVASGPFYLFKAFTTEKVIELRRFEDYPDPIGSWDFLIDM